MLLLKRQYADYANNKEIYESEFKKLDIKDDSYFGAACLVTIKRAEKKRRLARENGEEIITQDIGYRYLTLFPKEENFTIIAIYNVRSEFVQFTFNIGKNVKYKAKVPSIDELFLNIILTNNNEVEFVGEDELEKIYKSGNLKQKDYELARKTADKILHKFHNQAGFDEIKKISEKYLDILKNTVE